MESESRLRFVVVLKYMNQAMELQDQSNAWQLSVAVRMSRSRCCSTRKETSHKGQDQGRGAQGGLGNPDQRLEECPVCVCAVVSAILLVGSGTKSGTKKSMILD